MKRVYTFQVTFSKGMIETVKPDAQHEQTLVEGGQPLMVQQQDSVLWLENMNPNLQQESLVRRLPEGTQSDEFGNVVPLDIPRFASVLHTLGYSAVGTDSDSRILEAIIQGSLRLDVSRPFEVDSTVMFVGRYRDNTPVTLQLEEFLASSNPPEHTFKGNGTFLPIDATSFPQPTNNEYAPSFTNNPQGQALAVVMYNPHYGWYEAHRRNAELGGALMALGWYTFGWLGDVAKYGETIRFTTKLDGTFPHGDNEYFTGTTANDINRYLHPCYVYKYFSLKDKLLNDNKVFHGLPEYETSSEKTEGWIVKTPTMSFADNAFSIGVFVKDLEYNTFPYEYRWGCDNEINNTNIYGENDIEVLFFATWLHSRAIENASIYNENLLTSNQPKRNYTATTDDTIFGINRYTIYDYNDVEASAEQVYETFNKVIHSIEAFRLPDGGKLGAYYPIYLGGSRAKDAEASDNITNKKFPLDIYYYASGSGPDLEVTKFSMPNYLELNIPRTFLNGERLPYCVTANIDGIDVILLRDTLVVGKTSDAFSIFDYFSNVEYNSIATPPKSKRIGEWDLKIPGMAGGDLYVYEQFIAKIGTGHKFTGIGGVMYPMLTCTIRIKEELVNNLIGSNIKDIAVWFSKPDVNDSVLRSINIHYPTEPDGGMYSKPLVKGTTDDNLSNYALFKRFLISSPITKPVPYKDYNGQTFNTNSWCWYNDGTQVWAYAQPVVDEQLAGGDGNEIGKPMYVSALSVDPAINIDPTTLTYTPDFMIWDYPYEDTLILNHSVNYLKALGAGLICVCKGMTFIGDVIDKDGSSLPAKVFYSIVQNGVIAEDVFTEERYLHVGHDRHTALLNFREQLWVFSRYQITRVMFNQITDDTTWEFADVIHQGTLTKKTVCATPYGVCWLNEGGLWISDGGEPQNIGVAMLPTLQKLASNTPNVHTNLTSIDIEGNESHTLTQDHLELLYNYETDEVVLFSPIWIDDVDMAYSDGGDCAVAEFRAIFSFAYKNWRVERYDYV